MQRVFITGANRGLGLEVARQYLERGAHVFAAARSFDAVSQFDGQYSRKLTTVPLDVNDDAAIQAAAQTVRGITDGLDVLINNAAIFPRGARYSTVGKIESAAIAEVLRTNSIAPLMIVQAMLDLLKNGTDPKIVNITSQQGSMQYKTGGGSMAYAVSKAALNMVTRVLAGDLRSAGIISIMVHPGWVATDMGGSGAPISAERSASSLIRIIDGLTPGDNGAFFNYDGKPHQW